MKHPHEGRMAEVYHCDNTHTSGLRWMGYSAGPDYADHPQGAEWSDLLKGWVLPQGKTPKKSVTKVAKRS